MLSVDVSVVVIVPWSVVVGVGIIVGAAAISRRWGSGSCGGRSIVVGITRHLELI